MQVGVYDEVGTERVKNARGNLRVKDASEMGRI